MARQADNMVVVLDVGSSMGDEAREGNTRLQECLTAIEGLVQQRIMFGGKKDTVGLILVGDDTTENPLSARGLAGYDNIHAVDQRGDGAAGSEPVYLVSPHLELLRSIPTIPPTAQSADIVAGCTVAWSVLEAARGVKRVVAFTDGATPVDDEAQLGDIVAKFKDDGVQLEL